VECSGTERLAVGDAVAEPDKPANTKDKANQFTAMKVLMLKRTSFASNDQFLCFEFDFFMSKIKLDDYLKSVKIIN
jgi:hypothetical protein